MPRIPCTGCPSGRAVSPARAAGSFSPQRCPPRRVPRGAPRGLRARGRSARRCPAFVAAPGEVRSQRRSGQPTDRTGAPRLAAPLLRPAVCAPLVPSQVVVGGEPVVPPRPGRGPRKALAAPAAALLADVAPVVLWRPRGGRPARPCFLPCCPALACTRRCRPSPAAEGWLLESAASALAPAHPLSGRRRTDRSSPQVPALRPPRRHRHATAQPQAAACIAPAAAPVAAAAPAVVALAAALSSVVLVPVVASSPAWALSRWRL